MPATSAGTLSVWRFYELRSFPRERESSFIKRFGPRLCGDEPLIGAVEDLLGSFPCKRESRKHATLSLATLGPPLSRGRSALGYDLLADIRIESLRLGYIGVASSLVSHPLPVETPV